MRWKAFCMELVSPADAAMPSWRLTWLTSLMRVLPSLSLRKPPRASIRASTTCWVACLLLLRLCAALRLPPPTCCQSCASHGHRSLSPLPDSSQTGTLSKQIPSSAGRHYVMCFSSETGHVALREHSPTFAPMMLCFGKFSMQRSANPASYCASP